jgi:hypothetical protein
MFGDELHTIHVGNFPTPQLGLRIFDFLPYFFWKIRILFV